jgi:hypothetical protein
MTSSVSYCKPNCWIQGLEASMGDLFSAQREVKVGGPRMSEEIDDAAAL